MFPVMTTNAAEECIFNKNEFRSLDVFLKIYSEGINLQHKAIVRISHFYFNFELDNNAGNILGV